MKSISFSNTLRDRPMVVVGAQIQSLSDLIGRDVRTEVERMAGQHQPCKTVGQLLRRIAAELKTP